MGVPGTEVVIQKRPQIVVPHICAGCSAPPLAAWSLGVRRGLSLTVGLCQACVLQQRRTQSRSGVAFGVAIGVTTVAAIALFAAAPIGEALTWLVPALVASFATAVGLYLFRPKLTQIAPRLGVPFRSEVVEPRAAASPAVSAQLTRVRGNEALLFCANPHFAAELAAANGFAQRPVTRAPQLPYTTALVFAAALVGLTAGAGVWTHQYPTIAIDNGTEETVTVHLNGEPRWEVPPTPYDAPPMLVRAPRGANVIGYSTKSDATPNQLPAELGGWMSEHFVFNPGKRSCFRRYDVMYASNAVGSQNLLPRFQLFVEEASYIPRTDYFFTAPASSVQTKKSSETRSVVEKDEGCSFLLRQGCSIEPLLACTAGKAEIVQLEACYTKASEECAAAAIR
jgi:hypothetical protein